MDQVQQLPLNSRLAFSLAFLFMLMCLQEALLIPRWFQFHLSFSVTQNLHALGKISIFPLGNPITTFHLLRTFFLHLA